MSLSLAESQAVGEIASHLYDFLPASRPPYADQRITFGAVAQKVRVGQFWTGGSKLPAVTFLLENTLAYKRECFCDLIIDIVRTSLVYRKKSKNPVNREEIYKLNELLKRVQFKIPDLYDPQFLDSLPSIMQPAKPEQVNILEENQRLVNELIEISKMQSQQRGFAFEKFLNRLFTVNGLKPRDSFRLIGEQIDGSFQLAQDTYLLEAKWQNELTPEADLSIFHSRIGAKSTWARGLFVSNTGFSPDGLAAFSRGRATNMVGMTGEDLYFILIGEISLVEAIERKVRWAAETGEFYIRVYELKRIMK